MEQFLGKVAVERGIAFCGHIDDGLETKGVWMGLVHVSILSDLFVLVKRFEQLLEHLLRGPLILRLLSLPFLWRHRRPPCVMFPLALATDISTFMPDEGQTTRGAMGQVIAVLITGVFGPVAVRWNERVHHIFPVFTIYSRILAPYR